MAIIYVKVADHTIGRRLSGFSNHKLSQYMSYDDERSNPPALLSYCAETIWKQDADGSVEYMKHRRVSLAAPVDMDEFAEVKLLALSEANWETF